MLGGGGGGGGGGLQSRLLVDSTSGVARIIMYVGYGPHCQMQGLYETEKAVEKVHPSRPARGQCSRIRVCMGL